MKLTNKIILIIFLACFSLVNGQTNSEVLKRQAIENMQSGLYEKAIDRLKNYISINPSDADGYSLRGLCYERLNDYKNAVYDFKRAKQIDSTDSEILRNFERVETEWKNSIYKEIDAYKDEVKANPNYADNYLKIADNYILLENYTLAEKWYDNYLSHEHNSTPEEVLRYTEVFAKNGSIEKGENLLSVYEQKYPDDWRLFTRLGYFKLWAGKNAEAKDAFEAALKVKPFNKEAEEGLNLANSFVNFSVDEMLPMQNSYLIENYLQELLNDPNRDDIRFNLIEQLIKSGLYEEAYSHLRYLAPNYEGTSRFDDLMQLVEEGREEYSDKLIDSYKEKLNESDNDKETVMKLVNLYNKLRRYSDAEDIMENYLENNPDEDDVIYLLAKTLSYDAKYHEAYEQIKKAIELNSSEINYKILAAKLIVLNKDENNYDFAHNLLDEAIKKNPWEIDALTFLGRLFFLEGDYKEANKNATLAAQIDASNPDLVNLLLELEEKNPTSAPVIETKKEEPVKPIIPQISDLEIGRNLALNSKCDQAIDYYLDYIDDNSANKELLLELADVYNCAEKYSDAIDIYNFLLEKREDYQVQKLKAQSYYLDGDYDKTIDILYDLSANHLDDYDLQVLLADAYTGDGEYDSARVIYNTLETEAPEQYMVTQRKEWLPEFETEEIGAGAFSFISDYFFTYANLYPEVYFYRGNDGFNFNTLGTSGEIAFFKNISIGGNIHRGSISNDLGKLNYMTYVGDLIYRPSPNWKIKAGYGKMSSEDKIDQPIYEGSVEYEGQTRYTKYNAGAFYKYTDAATVMFSEGLVFSRLSTHYVNLIGGYRFRKGLNIDADYKLYILEETPIFKQNLGNSISIKISKEFYEDFKAGYEYNFADFKFKIPTYYSPQKFGSHSLWADWEVHTDAEWEINLIGRLGYIPDENHAIREISAKMIYKGFQNFRITANGFAGETSRNRADYRSFSFFLTASWNFIK